MVIAVIVLASFLVVKMKDADFKMTGKTTDTNPRVKLETNYGDIVVELYPQEAPITTSKYMHVGIDKRKEEIFITH